MNLLSYFPPIIRKIIDCYVTKQCNCEQLALLAATWASRCRKNGFADIAKEEFCEKLLKLQKNQQLENKSKPAKNEYCNKKYNQTKRKI